MSNDNEFNNVEASSLTISDKKTITIYKYKGSATPPECPFASNYPNAVRVGAESYFYNCHAYSWCFAADVSWQNNSDFYRFENISALTAAPNTCYDAIVNTQQLPSNINASSIRAGDIIVYYYDEDFDGTYVLAHSATVIQSASTFDDNLVRSKWGMYGVYTHKVKECSYYQSAGTAPGGHATNGGMFKVYRTNTKHKALYTYTTRAHRASCEYCPVADHKNYVHEYTKVGMKYYCHCGYSTTKPILTQSLPPVKKEKL